MGNNEQKKERNIYIRFISSIPQLYINGVQDEIPKLLTYKKIKYDIHTDFYSMRAFPSVKKYYLDDCFVLLYTENISKDELNAVKNELDKQIKKKIKGSATPFLCLLKIITNKDKIEYDNNFLIKSLKEVNDTFNVYDLGTINWNSNSYNDDLANKILLIVKKEYEYEHLKKYTEGCYNMI